MDYDKDLDMWLQTTIDMHEQARTEYWEERLASEDWSPLKQLREDADGIAASIRKRAMALQNIGDLSEVNDIYQVYLAEREAAKQDARRNYEHIQALIKEKLKEKEISREDADMILQGVKKWVTEAETSRFDPHEAEDESDRPLHLIWERLCIDDAWCVVSTIRDRVRRIFELERLIDDVLQRNEPPVACIEFLALVSRSYIYGFVPECVSMCRSAIDAAFRDKVSDDHCERARRHIKPYGYSLDDKIKAAFHPENRLLPAQLERHANTVRQRGIKAIHYDANATKDASGTIRAALLVIDGLSRLATLDD